MAYWDKYGNRQEGSWKLSQAGSGNGFVLASNRNRNKPMLKLNAADLRRAVSASDGLRAETAGVRKGLGLPELEDGVCLAIARSRLRGMATVAPKATPLTVEDLRKAKRKLRRDTAKLDADVRTLIANKAAPVREIADALDVSPQRVYQIAG